MLIGMRRVAERMPLPLVERLARSAVGRAALTSTIYARPGAVPRGGGRRDARPRGATGFTETLRAGTAVRFTDDVPGIPVTVAWGAGPDTDRQGIRAKRIIPRPGWSDCPAAARPDERRPALVARVILDGSR
ncbi:hypothetical protein GCM10023238_24020 [Streptomyces heliomycini]